MLVAIGGAQGTGKTTTLNAIASRGYHVIERKTARSLLTDWGVSLKEVNANQELTVKFQDELLERKFQDEASVAINDEICFTERSFVDLFVYALIAVGKNNDYSDWINQYYTRCMLYNQIYSATFYIQAGTFLPEHDGVRGANQHYSKLVDGAIYRFSVDMLDLSDLATPTLNSVSRSLSTPDQRASYIINRTVEILPQRPRDPSHLPPVLLNRNGV